MTETEKKPNMRIFHFMLREGSSILFSIYLMLFGMLNFCIACGSDNTGAMFVVSAICMAYLALQCGMASFSRVGNDQPLFDFFFSLLPLFTLLMIAILAIVGSVTLSGFKIMALILATAATLIDVVFNTQVIFKMNRLATDMVQMK